jgi:DNA-binding transcriptional regulator YiaG
VSEEVQKVADAMEAVEKIEDPEERVRAMSAVLRAQTTRTKKWRKERAELVHQMRAETPPVSYREIAARLGMTLATVQDLERGYTGSGSNRPRKSDGATE